MRLTLRTLLAWLDDTLSPAEVREIGKQVSESPFAQELVERIQRVTRQRRLTVPNSSGADATDPNLVASYLDNELDQDLVPEYEKLCLGSDVHLAEVASVHQVLSLIGQKAKVPAEAKNRMYHLIRGREAIAAKDRATPPAPPAPVSEPVQPWITPPPPRRPWLERYGPAAAALALLVLLGWSAWMSLKQPPEQTPYLAGGPPGHPQPAPPAAGKEAVPPKAAAETQPTAVTTPPGQTTDTAGPTAVAKAEAAPSNPVSEEMGNEAGPRPEFPTGIIGMTEKSDGILLRYDTARREWQRLLEPTPIKPQDRLLGLDPFRSTLVLGSARVDLVGETEVWLSSAPPNEAARFQLAEGRVVLHGTSPALPFEVPFGGKNVLITPPTGGRVGVERISRFEPGNPASAGSVLRVYGAEGEVMLEVEGTRETLASPGGIAWDGSHWAEKSDKPAPAWVTEDKPTAYDLQIGEQFLRFFRPNRGVIADMVEALDDDQKDVRRLAIRALKVVGELSFLVPVLSTADDPTARREAIRVLRAELAQGPDAAKAVHDQLVRDLGEEEGKAVEKLLIGFTAKEARDEATFANLVRQLSAPEVGVRELALDNLRTLTGRDDLEYDPDKPDAGRGLRAWSDLLKNHELRPPAAAARAEK